MKFPRATTVCGITLLACSPAMAHPFHGDTTSVGFADGLLHAVVGVDHVVIALAVGLLGAALRGTAQRWVLGSFVITMGLGAIAGLEQGGVHLVPHAAAVAIALLGLGLLCRQANRTAMVIIASLSGICCGFAHAAQVPAQALAGTYLFGLLAGALMLQAVALALCIPLIARRRAVVGASVVGH